MGDTKKVPLNESYSYLRKSFDNLNNQQSSSESAPKLFPNVNNCKKNQANNSNSSQKNSR